jgi:hypothetical protein
MKKMAGFLLAMAALTPATANSTVYAPTTIDSILLRSDEIPTCQ